MNSYLLYNGKFHKSTALLVGADSRGLRYGDGLFETLRFVNGHIAFGEWHFERLFQGLALLAFELPAYFTPAYLTNQVVLLCKKNQLLTARVRINIFRGNGGLYDMETHAPHWIIQGWEMPNKGLQFNEKGLVAGLYPNARKTMDTFSNLKSNNYLPYVMAALHAEKQQWNEAFLFNTAGNICDATVANIFTIKDKIIYTCPLQEGCVAGIMRRFLLQNLTANGFECQEKIITRQDLLAAEEVFTTNAVKGVRWVSHCGEASYTNGQTSMIFEKLLKEW